VAGIVGIISLSLGDGRDDAQGGDTHGGRFVTPLWDSKDMAEHREAVRVLEDLWAMMDVQQWDKIPDLLDPALQVRYVHTGEVMDAESYVRLNRDYPGRWRAAVSDLVGSGDRAASCTRIYDDEQTFWVASFATIRNGRITDMVEVWTEAGQQPPPNRPSA
jgi:hypothetical protein